VTREGWFRERIEPLRHRPEHGLVREHLARYRFAAGWARGEVLDAGCGTGYGTLLLRQAPGVSRVLGVDVDERAVGWARRWRDAPGVCFRRLDLCSGTMAYLGRFETVVCLEVLEHLSDPERLLARLDHCLAPGGRLVISTPLGRGRGVPSGQPFHRFQLRRAEFEELLAPRFRWRLFGQKGELIEPWRRGGRYFLMLAICRSRSDAAAGESQWSATYG
jgi:2-polyprenyl-3-methyl-5-hydroxy-6-metoxy-1,4-benzoquinol methylase